MIITNTTILNTITIIFSSSYYFIHSFIFFILEIPVIRSAGYKLPIIREICICMLSLYIKMEFKKKSYHRYRKNVFTIIITAIIIIFVKIANIIIDSIISIITKLSSVS